MENAYYRSSTSLNGYWKYIVDPYENGFYNYRYQPFDEQEKPGNGAFFLNAKRKGNADLIEYNFDLMDSLLVPGDWNTQKERLFYYEGTVWYKKSFDYAKEKIGNRVFLHVGAANYETVTYVNGVKVGTHTGGFTPFQYEITDLIKPLGNFIIFKVDNKRYKDAVPTLNTDWWNYGGVTRDIKLIETSSTFLRDYTLNTNPANEIVGSLVLDGVSSAKVNVNIDIPALGIFTTVETDSLGKASFSIPTKNLELWSITSPTLYEITISTGEDSVKDKIGFRTIETSGTDILLNGEQIFLKGISIHEESPYSSGRGNSRKDARKLLEWAKALGCNYVRLAHYPHNEHMVRLADEMGMLVWEENPVYWTISWSNTNTYLTAQKQLAELINRDKNRASVIIWSMANETPNSKERNEFLWSLAKYARKVDPSRLISAALEQESLEGNPYVRTIADPFAETVDILSFNQYIGWYDGAIEKCRRISWEIEQDKPVIISEFGAGAKYGLHGEKDERWTEEYQAYLYEETLKMIDEIDQLRGLSPWILVDFRSPRRVLPGVQENYNRKGLISEKGERKQAFFVLRDYYNGKR